MLQVRPVSDALKKVTEKELNELPKRVHEDINHIRNWLSQQPHIQARTDDQFLLSFLRGTKFSLERAKEKLDSFYTMRTMMPAYFTNRDPFLLEIQNVLNAGVILPLPKTVGADGPKILLGRIGNMSIKETPFPSLVKTFLMICDILLYEDDNCIIAGQSGFGDFEGASLEYLLSINLNEIRKVEKCLIEAYPTRPKAINLINVPTVYEALINFIRALLPDKLKNRVHVYSTRNSEDIYKIWPRSVLPKEYGGESVTVDEITANWKKKVESYRDWFLEDDKYGVDETKRREKSKVAEKMLGIDGSFRKLDID